MTAQHSHEPTTEGVAEAARRIHALLPCTPLIPSVIGGIRIWLKDETAQPIRAFKIRGAWNRLNAISSARRKYGVIAVSSGNHALGVAWGAARLGIAVTVLMPRDTPAVKRDAVNALGARIVYYSRLQDDRDAMAADLCAQTGATLIHAFADPWVIEGQGSVATEIAAQLGQDPSRIIAPCGGGGLLSGSALACPDAQLIAVEPEGWDDAAQSIATGGIASVASDAPPTICDGIQTPRISPMTLKIMHEHKITCMTVNDQEVATAMRFAFDHHAIVLEPSGAAGLAAALSGSIPLDETSAVVLTGGNVDPVQFTELTGRTPNM
ncbi:pyridoxal-5'-phosphate-dependent protein [Croceicoccus estronivorus]|uniref:threonine ammonia-lyase n=1 Tax=Croceicoccus estronivorus TaxID=1172626 RepID=UPI000831454E|nr:threonine/serine dehydratase [Croceicoccus estronivorus]OCC24844.1 pyridoxal-5'-phosphate-dependent protein [Croceicoccus estronivorus]